MSPIPPLQRLTLLNVIVFSPNLAVMLLPTVHTSPSSDSSCCGTVVVVVVLVVVVVVVVVVIVVVVVLLSSSSHRLSQLFF